MQDARTRWTIIGAVFLALLGSGVGLYAGRHPAPAPIVITQPGPMADPPPPITNTQAVAAPAADPTPAPNVPAAASKPAPAPRYYVHVAGAVKHPSLYLLPPGSRVMQAIKAAGSPTARANLDSVNLAEKVRDGEKVYVPAKVAAAPMLAPPGNALGHESVLPDAPAASSSKPAKTAKATVAAKPTKLTSPAQGQVNINTASAEQLERLPGIGPAMAARILAFRQQSGGFKQLEDLQQVGGIGPKKYAKIAPLAKLK